jgi:uncharacterized membrane protein (UPF0127 family)
LISRQIRPAGHAAWVVASALFALLLVTGPAALAQASEDVVRLPVEQVIVTTDKGDIAFATEIATNDETRSRGLMFRRSMGEREAMLFYWPSPLAVSMWMRNTYLSLDMLFVAADGTVVHVEADTVPQSLDELSAGREVSAVMELVAGTAIKLGIRPGSRLKHRFFDGS